MDFEGIDLDWLGLEVERQLCAKSFSYFVSKAWSEIDPTPFKPNWHIDVICQHLEAVSRGEITRLAICIPPGHGKSLLVSVLFPAWEWGPGGKPHMSYLSTSHSQDFSSRDTRRARDLIQSEWYQRLWPIDFKPDQDSKTYYINSHMGQRQAKAFGSLTGARGHRLLIDDPISANDALSEAARESVKTITLESVPTRLNNVETDAIIVIAQRLHHEDIIGVLEEADIGYEILSIPSEYQGEEYFKTSLNIRDPRADSGEKLIFPTYQNQDTMNKFKKSLGPYGFASQFLQMPSPRTNGFFERDWFKLYSHNERPPIEEMNVYLTSDHAPSGNGDNNVIRVWGIDTRHHYWLLDSYVDKSTMDVAMGYKASEHGGFELLDTGAFPLIKKWKPLYWFPENDPTWKAIAPQVNMVMRQLRLYTNIKPLALAGQGNKEVKAQAYQGNARQGFIHLPNNAETQDTLAEYMVFPKGKHDDRVDADANICRAEGLFPGVIHPPVYKPVQNKDYRPINYVDNTNEGYI